MEVRSEVAPSQRTCEHYYHVVAIAASTHPTSAYIGAPPFPPPASAYPLRHSHKPAGNRSIPDVGGFVWKKVSSDVTVGT